MELVEFGLNVHGRYGCWMTMVMAEKIIFFYPRRSMGLVYLPTHLPYILHINHQIYRKNVIVPWFL